MEINSFIIISLLAMFVMTLAVILFVVLYQRRVIKHQIEVKVLNTQKELEVLRASIQSEEEERKRIAQELHDDVGATLSSARLFLNSTNNQINTEQIAISKSLIDDSLNKIRLVSYRLQPSSLNALGLQSAVQNTVDLLNKSEQMEATLSVSHGFPRLDSFTELHLYRIIQEIITNITKHSKAQNLWMEMYAKDQIQISVSHNGQGLTNEKFSELLSSTAGQGLKNITNRVRIVNGEINHFFDNGIFRVLISTPVPNDAIK